LIAFVDIIDCGHELWITDIAVNPGYRGRGLASRLFKAVIYENSSADIALACCAITMDLQECPRTPVACRPRPWPPGMPGTASAPTRTRTRPTA
jgi:GNAT superfamily N-acetyltransferase